MKNFFRILWLSGILVLFVFAFQVASIICKMSILDYISISLISVSLFLVCYVVLFGLLFPLLWDLYKDAIKLDKGVK